MRLAFNNDGVGVGASRKRRYNLVKVENQSQSGVISSTESGLEEWERFHFFRFRLRLRCWWSQWKLCCRSQKQKRKNQPNSTTQFSLDRKWRRQKQNQYSASDYPSVFQFWFDHLILAPTTTLSVASENQPYLVCFKTVWKYQNGMNYWYIQ